MSREELTGQLRLASLDPLLHHAITVRKRDGRQVPFDETRIQIAIESAFKAAAGQPLDGPLSDEQHGLTLRITDIAMRECLRRAVHGEALEIELIQDCVESALMSSGQHAVARGFILYRETRRQARAWRGDRTIDGQPQAELHVTQPDGRREPIDLHRLRRELLRACRGLEARCSWTFLADEAWQSLYDGVPSEELSRALILAARARIEVEPAYSQVAARLLLNVLFREVWPSAPERAAESPSFQRDSFGAYISEGIHYGRLTPELATFDLSALAKALEPSRDDLFNYMGLQTLYDRYLLHHEGRRFETPQFFWMRVAMGLALGESANRETRAVAFYDTLSTFRFVCSTPTLFNAGTCHPQLSSCYLSTVRDDLDHIFKVIADDARLSKWAGGLGNDWTNIRATGASIRGTNGTSQGVIPFLKVANDTAIAVNQGGKRKGAMCAYLETWHLDIEDFLELRKNTGDERRRTHDMNTANWIPDLFMQRVRQQAHWTLFNPADVPDLHDLYGRAFAERYEHYEQQAASGGIKLFKRVEATVLWRKMLTCLFETGHPWITFKDPSNLRSPQNHVGVVHSSNLCTEILLNTSADETAVCNLGSLNLAAHLRDGEIDEAQLAATIRTAVRMLDNVIDINFYPTPEARLSNLQHRPIGLGLMGFQDALYELGLPYASAGAIEFADRNMEFIAYHTLLASAELAHERGAYPTFRGSKWDGGFLPVDTIASVTDARSGQNLMDRTMHLDWTPVREAIRGHGLRHSNTMAIAPTATISNITGVSQSIEPTYKNLYAKSNLSGEFTTINVRLVEQLRRRGLWDAEMIDDLKYYDGSIQEIERVPAELKELFRTAFEIEPRWLLECASRRQKWIDMGQSLNLYLASPDGRALSEMYMLAWELGLKTTYYLRTVAATQIEKSTLDVNRRGLQPRWMKSPSASSQIKVERTSPPEPSPRACSILDPGCESCQ